MTPKNPPLSSTSMFVPPLPALRSPDLTQRQVPGRAGEMAGAASLLGAGIASGVLGPHILGMAMQQLEAQDQAIQETMAANVQLANQAQLLETQMENERSMAAWKARIEVGLAEKDRGLKLKIHEDDMAYKRALLARQAAADKSGLAMEIRSAFQTEMGNVDQAIFRWLDLVAAGEVAPDAPFEVPFRGLTVVDSLDDLVDRMKSVSASILYDDPEGLKAISGHIDYMNKIWKRFLDRSLKKLDLIEEKPPKKSLLKKIFGSAETGPQKQVGRGPYGAQVPLGRGPWRLGQGQTENQP